jgi:hypothetical protein
LAEAARSSTIKPLAYKSIPRILKNVRQKAGLNIASNNYNNRFTIKTAHGFRKFFNTTVKNIRTQDGLLLIDFITKERLMGHALVNQHRLEKNYDRSDHIRVLLEAYIKAISELTISEEERLELNVKRLEKDVSSLKSVEIELVQKDKEIQSNAGRIADLEKTVASLKEGMKELATLAGKNIENAVTSLDLE